ncbi:MAG TPA: hypothetical protein VNZ52_15875 [Candidatus Thermoplasmatota archaeon]|nr:hypothetical protein [Candidatus Thermoplasmatota archaeon]
MLKTSIQNFRVHVRDPLYRNSYFWVADMAAVGFFGMLYWFLAARLEVPGTVGLATSVAGTLTLISVLSRVGLDVLLLRNLPRASPGQFRRMFNHAMLIAGALSVVGALVAYFLLPRAAPELLPLASGGMALLVFTIFALTWTENFLLESALAASRKTVWIFAKDVAQGLLRLPLLWVLAPDFGAVGIIVAYFFPSLLTVALLIGKVLPAVVPGYSFGLAWGGIELRFLSSLAANYAVALVNNLPVSVGSLVILWRFGAEATALYYVLWMVGSLTLMAPVALARSSLVEMARKSETKAPAYAKPLLISGALAACVFVVALVVLPLFGTHYAQGGMLALLPFALAALPAVFQQLRIAQLRAAGQDAALLAIVGLAIGGFLLLIATAPIQVEFIGWLYFVSISVAAVVGRFIPVHATFSE